MKRTIHHSPFGTAKTKPSPSPRRNAGKASKENVAPAPDSQCPKIKSPLPPRPPPSNPLKRKLCLEAAGADHAASCSDSGVQVIVRLKPLNKDEQEGGMVVGKVSDDSVSVGGHTFTFDAIADIDSTQQDIFQLVGAPLVENCLAGFNSSVFAYGQTGSGKTYTMWGPANALSEEKLSSDQQGLTPRVFQRLFARINEEQLKHSDKQLNYQCRCSFLEIYNEQITDLLDPSQRNLQIREDVKSGVYVENLREEYVFTVKDVMRLLAKGFSNRRTGATSINAESSRSHSVFTCVLDSRCKRIADGISSLKTSRINLVDLAGSERQKSTGAAGDRLKEAGNINRSLSQLGNLINILAEVSQTGKQRHIPYRDSRLTFLLQESLGGNAKLAMVCAVSPSLSCKSESFSTLRFAQRAKAIKNKAVVNEEMEDDVNHLREIIKQLKDELHRVKENGNNQTAWDPRKSLNLLRSLIHPHERLPRVDEDGDLEMEVDEEAVENVCKQVDQEEIVDAAECRRAHASEKVDVDMKEGISGDVGKHDTSFSTAHEDNTIYPSDQVKHLASLDLSIVPCEISPALELPTRSVSPKISISRKSLRTSLMVTASQGTSKDEKASSIVVGDEALVQSRKRSTNAMDMQKRKSSFAQTENLATSLHRGLEIIQSRQKSLAFRRSSFRFIKPTESKSTSPFAKVDVGVQTSSLEDDFSLNDSPFAKVDVGVQTSSHEDDILLNDSEPNLCVNCQKRIQVDLKDDDYSNLQLVPVDGSDVMTKTKVTIPKAVEMVLAGAIRREMALEDFCGKQASEIKQLNRLVQQYKHERECNAIIGQTREDKILRLESLVDGALSSEEYLEEELAALHHENQILKEKCENHPDVLRMKLELKSVHEELETYRNFCDLGEREVLMEEIQDLRTQLNYYLDSSSSTQKRISLLKLSCALQPGPTPLLDMIPESTESSDQVTLEEERRRWTETESKWISLAEELRSELEATHMMAEKQKQELDEEKRCAQDLREAMQTAMEGHARMLEQYADLEEKHMLLLERHRNIQEGIVDVKKAASRAGTRGAESKFINALAAEITALKAEREKEKCYLRDENRGLRAQLRDTAEAVQAAGELLVRLKEAEEAVSIAEKRAMDAEDEATKTFGQMENLKRQHENEISNLKGLLVQPRLPDEAIRPDINDCEMPRYDARESVDGDGDGDQRWKEELAPFYKGEDSELSKFTEPSSWFSGYDRCNI